MMVSTRVVFSGSDGSSDPYRQSEVVVVDLPVERFVGDLEAPEVVLAMRVIVSGEVLERLHQEQRLGLHVERQLADALRHDDGPADERRAEVVVKQANARLPFRLLPGS